MARVKETKPDEAKPEETKPDETKPDETKPEETKPEELIRMVNEGEELNVHPTCVAAHEACGWTVA